VKIKNLFIGLFATCFVAMGAYVLYMSSSNKAHKIKNATYNGTLTRIYQGYKGKPNYKIGVLKDSSHFVLENKMIGHIVPGDSIHKYKNDDFYTVTTKSGRRIIFYIE
jgi:hypothetical protein